LRRLHDEIKLTSVFVTHDQEEALELADRVVVMNQGRIEQDGAPSEVFHRPANAFVMDFLGNVNLFHGRVVSGEYVYDSSPAATAAVPFFVRPHEIELRRNNADKLGFPATVRRVQLAGSSAKIELTDRNEKEIYVEMSHEKYGFDPFQTGGGVFVVPKKTVVFHEDYTI
jgi:sulfate transport system ATP-binding protein